jgi:hypothetical protein
MGEPEAAGAHRTTKHLVTFSAGRSPWWPIRSVSWRVSPSGGLGDGFSYAAVQVADLPVRVSGVDGPRRPAGAADGAA